MTQDEINNDYNIKQTCYRVTPNDNVATALGLVEPGLVFFTGKDTENMEQVTALQKILFGHKIALRDIRAGESIIKYNAVMGTAIRDIRKGEHVHLHNIKSNIDYRAETFDAETAMTTDIEYRVY